MAASVQDVIMLFGDSLTQGAWAPGDAGIGQRLSHVYARKLDVLNRGFSGYNTEWGLPVFEQCLAKNADTAAPKLKLLIIWFGANDACIKPSPQHVALDKFEANIRQMVNMILSPTSPYYSPATRIILITTPPINTHQRKADLEARDPPMQLDRLFETTKAYATAVKNIAMEVNAGVVDAWTLLWEAAGRDEGSLGRFSPDGLHLNEAGYEILYEDLIKVIAEKYPDVHYDNLGFTFPQWKDINWESPASSLYLRKGEVKGQ